MAQVTSGLRSVLSASFAYDALQNLLGAKNARRRLVNDYIKPTSGDILLDVGCGTCAILDYLPSDVIYIGMDLSQKYIDTASEKYHGRGQFYCMDVAAVTANDLPLSNIGLAVGLIHHLDNEQVIQLFRAIEQRLAPGGRLVTVDPCYHQGQSALARLLISKDRGRNVRAASAYCDLASSVFCQVNLIVSHDLSRVPYTHAILECRKQ